MSEIHSNAADVSDKKIDTSKANDSVDPNKRIDTSKNSQVSQSSGDVNPNKRATDVPQSGNKSSATDEINPNKRVEENKDKSNEGEKSENKEENYPPNSTIEIDGKECKTDDNGKVYSEDGKLKPNCEYTLNGNHYKTDSKGRIIKASGDVKIPDKERDSLPDIKNKDKKDTDDKGHVIGHQIGGADTEGNLVPQDKNLNRGEYNKLEKELAKLKKEGHDVKVEITLKYKGDSDRPDSFRVKYTVDGKTYVKTFKNEPSQNGGK